MEWPSIDLLVTTMNKNADEVKTLVLMNNLQGNVIVGNQNGTDSRTTFQAGKAQVTLISLSSVGVSRNRNALLKESQADYVLFLDDDITIEPNFFSVLKEGIQMCPDAVGIHFNVQSANPKRPIPQYSQNKKLPFRKTTSLGIFGTLLRRQYLIDQQIFFDENMGPGTTINHGEDTVFFHDLSRRTKKLYQNNGLLGTASQTASSWWGKSQKENLIGVGYMYQRMFGWLAFPCAVFHSLKHRSHYRDMSWLASLRVIKEGIRMGKKSNR